MYWSFFLATLISFGAFASNEGSALRKQSFLIGDVYFKSSQRKIEVLVSYGCGCGKNIFTFKNLRSKPEENKQEIDLELLSNNSCKAECNEWESLPLSAFPQISTKFPLIIHATNPRGSVSHHLDFTKVTPVQRQRNGIFRVPEK